MEKIIKPISGFLILILGLACIAGSIFCSEINGDEPFTDGLTG